MEIWNIIDYIKIWKENLIYCVENNGNRKRKKISCE